MWAPNPGFGEPDRVAASPRFVDGTSAAANRGPAEPTRGTPSPGFGEEALPGSRQPRVRKGSYGRVRSPQENSGPNDSSAATIAPSPNPWVSTEPDNV